MPTVLIKLTGERADPYIAAVKKHAPDFDIREWPDVGPAEGVDAALVWQMPPGELVKFPNLKVVVSMAAGVDHVLRDTSLPSHIPIARVVDPSMARSMTQHVVMSVIRLHRDIDAFTRRRGERFWPEPHSFSSDDFPVGFLGLGHLGTSAATALKALGFPVMGWSRTPKSVDGVETFHGTDGLDTMLRRTQCLVCLLPLTAETRGLLSAETFAKLPKGACLVNAGRGQHLVEGDLIPALNTGQIARAALDVFETEPLPADHPFWDEPRIAITPHDAAEVHIPAVASLFVEQITAAREGRPIPGLVDRERGY